MLFSLTTFGFTESVICSKFENSKTPSCGNATIVKVKKMGDSYANCSAGQKNCITLAITAGHVSGGDQLSFCHERGKCEYINRKKYTISDNLRDISIIEIKNPAVESTLNFNLNGKISTHGQLQKGKFFDPLRSEEHEAIVSSSGGIVLPLTDFSQKSVSLPFKKRKDDPVLLGSGSRVLEMRVVPGISGSPYLKFREGDGEVLDGIITQYNRVFNISYAADSELVYSLINDYMRGARGDVKSLNGKKVSWKYDPKTKSTYRVVGDGEYVEIPDIYGESGGDIGDGGGGDIGDGGGDIGDGSGKAPCRKKWKGHLDKFVTEAEKFLEHFKNRLGLDHNGRNVIAFEVKDKISGKKVQLLANWESLVYLENNKDSIEYTPLYRDELNLKKLIEKRYGKKGSFGKLCRGETCTGISYDSFTGEMTIDVSIRGEKFKLLKVKNIEDIKPWHILEEANGSGKAVVDIRSLFFTNLYNVHVENSESLKTGKDKFDYLLEHGGPQVTGGFVDKRLDIAIVAHKMKIK